MTIECIPLKYNRTPDKGIRLVRAAVCGDDDKVYTGWRHADISWYMHENGISRSNTTDAEGFIDQHGNYYRRRVCGSIAWSSGQLKEFKNIVNSEDFWDNNGNSKQ